LLHWFAQGASTYLGQADIMSRGMEKDKSLEEKVSRAISGGLPFKRIHVRLSSNELAKITSYAEAPYFDRAMSESCMGEVSCALHESTGIYIPPFIRTFPFLSFLYFKGAHALGNRRIIKIESYGSSTNNAFNFLVTPLGPTFECLGFLIGSTAALGMTAIAAAITTQGVSHLSG
jgi:hypothetical protein